MAAQAALECFDPACASAWCIAEDASVRRIVTFTRRFLNSDELHGGSMSDVSSFTHCKVDLLLAVVLASTAGLSSQQTDDHQQFGGSPAEIGCDAFALRPGRFGRTMRSG